MGVLEILFDFNSQSLWMWLTFIKRMKNIYILINVGLVSQPYPWACDQDKGGCKVTSQERSPRVTFHAPRNAKECEGMNLHTPKWTPSWELKSQWTPEYSEHNYKGQNPSSWKKNYTIGKLLKCKCLKWACIPHLDIWNTSYDQKKKVEN